MKKAVSSLETLIQCIACDYNKEITDMYERMLNKQQIPDEAEIKEYVGKAAFTRMTALENILSSEYDLKKELRFPFGNHYGWGMKYSHKTMHLCYAFFEKDAFTVMVQVGDRQVSALIGERMSKQAKRLWDDRYPCGDNGGWVNVRILSDLDLKDALLFIHAKKKSTSISIN